MQCIIASIILAGLIVLLYKFDSYFRSKSLSEFEADLNEEISKIVAEMQERRRL